jgi:hypothetical protein
MNFRLLSFLFFCVIPDDLLEFANVEVPAFENIAIMGDGATQHLGLHLIPG